MVSLPHLLINPSYLRAPQGSREAEWSPSYWSGLLFLLLDSTKQVVYELFCYTITRTALIMFD